MKKFWAIKVDICKAFTAKLNYHWLKLRKQIMLTLNHLYVQNRDRSHGVRKNAIL